MQKTIFIFLIPVLLACSRDQDSHEIILIPNGYFENWDNSLFLLKWKTNSCPVCDPPFETYIIQQETNAYSGQFAAKFIYNNVYAARAENIFPVYHHPSLLTAYIKSSITEGDTVSIKTCLYKNRVPADSGIWIGTSSISSYTRIEIPVSQNNPVIDSAYIRIEGGTRNGTVLWVDQLEYVGR